MPAKESPDSTSAPSLATSPHRHVLFLRPQPSSGALSPYVLETEAGVDFKLVYPWADLRGRLVDGTRPGCLS